MASSVSIIDKNQTGIASEFFVAAELFRRKWDVTISFGSTKKFDLLAYKNNTTISIQVKGMHYTKAGNWNIDKSKISPTDNLYIIFVNLNSDKVNECSPEFFILSSLEAHQLIISTNKAGLPVKPNYIPYGYLKSFKNNWERFDNVCNNTPII